MVKALSAFAVCLLLAFAVFQIGPCQTQSADIDGWIIEDNGGSYTQTGDTLHLWSNGGIDCPGITLWKEIEPTDDLSFSVEVNAETSESCAIFVRESPVAGSIDGFNFEFGHYGEEVFLLARNYSNWMTSQVATGDPHVWYTMQLNISRSPFLITASVFTENGTCVGSFSTLGIVNFDFEDIRYIGLGVWGYSPADYSFRNVECSLDCLDSTLSIFTESSSSTTGATVNVLGTLTNEKGLPLQNKTIVLSYTFQGLDSWIPISSATTNEHGEYSMQWINSASGTFTLKTEWRGDSTSTNTSNTTTLSFLPTQNQQVFVFESNSTVTALAFDNQTSILSFNVTGPSNTAGFIRATIDKSLLANGENLQAYIDGRQLEYTVTSTDDSWVYCFNYSHSTHQIRMHIEATQASSSSQPVGNEIVLIIIVAVFGVILGVLVYLFNRRGRQETV
jgi:hypothetical protein